MDFSRYEKLRTLVRANFSEQTQALVDEALVYADGKLAGLTRYDGTPLLAHAAAVAAVVISEVGLGRNSTISAILHDVVRLAHKQLPAEEFLALTADIRSRFGEQVVGITIGMCNISELKLKVAKEQAGNFRDLLVSYSEDPRVILIKLADRLEVMRSLEMFPREKWRKKSWESMNLYAQIAHKLGLYNLKSELEDIALKYLEPKDYEHIVTKLEESAEERRAFIARFLVPIEERLNRLGIKYHIKSRTKSIFSIWTKMHKQHVPFEGVYDIFAIRIIIDCDKELEKQQCWTAYSVVTDFYTPNPNRMRDWISIPKSNGYESLHTTVSAEGRWVEVQIRSQRMEEIAERGFAAHWKYKSTDAEGRDEGEFDRWIKQVREALNSPTENAVEFLDNFKLSLYTNEIVVFTPKGESRTLPQGATALDFAYDIHTNIGNSAIGAKINHKIESIFTPIQSGDQIEIITSQNVKPKTDWLDHVATTKAKQCIISFLKKEKINNINRGREVFEARLHEFGIPPSARARVFRKVLPAYECTTKDEFYSKLGAGIINLDGLEKVLRENSASKILKFWTLQIPNPFKFLNGDDRKKAQTQNGGKDSGKETGAREATDGADADFEQPQFVIAPCCNPIPGDEVVGYKNPDTHKVDVHKKSCNELIKLASQHGNNLTPVAWSSHKAMSYLTILELRGIDRVGILMELSQVITGELNTNIRELRLQSHDGIFEGSISLYVKDLKDLKLIMEKVGKIKGVEKITRVENLKE